MNWLVEFLSSKEMSLFCFILNFMCAIGAFVMQDLGWLIFSLLLSIVCLNNFYNKLEEEND